MNYYILLDPASGAALSGGVSMGDVPTNAVACTQAQAQNYLDCTVINGVVTGPTVKAASLVPQALVALTKSDLVALRCFKSGVVFPTEWLAYVQALRKIANGSDTTSTVLPTAPSYPAGT